MAPIFIGVSEAPTTAMLRGEKKLSSEGSEACMVWPGRVGGTSADAEVAGGVVVQHVRGSVIQAARYIAWHLLCPQPQPLRFQCPGLADLRRVATRGGKKVDDVQCQLDVA